MLLDKIKKSFDIFKTNIIYNAVTVAVLYLISIILYQFFINNLLISNNDPMVLSTFSFAGKTTISLGRWFLPVIDIILAGVKAEPLQTYGALLFLCLSITIIFEIFSIKSMVIRIVLGIFIITSPSVYYLLSYRYTSYEYFIGLFFAVSCAYVLLKYDNGFFESLLSTILFILTLAIYQYFIAITLVVVVVFLINSYSNNKNTINNKKTIIFTALTFIVGSIIYKVIWEFFKAILKINVSVYRGVDKINITNILINIPKAIFQSYSHFYNYFFNGTIIKYNVFKIYAFSGFILVIMFITFVCLSYKNNINKTKNLINFVFTLLLIILLPIVLSITNFLTPGDLSMDARGTISYALLIPILISLLLSNNDIFDIQRQRIIIGSYLKRILIVFSIIILHCQLLQMSIDFDCMYNTKNTCTNIMTILLSKLNNDGLLDNNHKYLFFGDLGNNELYYVEDYKIPYTNFALEPNPFFIIGRGDSLINGDWDMQRRFGIIRNYMGIAINKNVSNFYNDVYKKYLYFIDTDEYIAAKPFPSNEGIFTINDVVIVKLSN